MNQAAYVAEAENGMVVGAQAIWDKQYGEEGARMSRGKQKASKVELVLAEMRALLNDRSRICARRLKAQDMALSIGGGAVHDMPRVKRMDSRIEVGVLEKNALEMELEELDAKLALCRKQLEGLIARMSAGVERAVLKMRYIQYMRVTDIAQEMNFCRIYIYKLLERAEQKMKELT